MPALLCCVVFGVAACDPPADGKVIAYRLEADGDKSDASARAETAAKVISARLHAVGLDGIGVGADAHDGLFKLLVPKALVPQIDAIRRIAERPGTLELRLLASQDEERIWRDRVNDRSSPVDMHPALVWVPGTDGKPDFLVRTPERPPYLALKKLEEKGVAKDSAEYRAAAAAYETAVRENVFTGDQIVRAEVQHQSGQVVVFFAFKDERKAAFGAFTEKHVNEALAIIIDGKVDSAPIIKSKLPGEGIIEGGHGPTGFTEQEAKELAGILSSGKLPGRLVYVSTQEPK
jgi:hypothetical protein